VILNSNRDKQHYCNCDKHQYSMSRHTYYNVSAMILQSNHNIHSITVLWQTSIQYFTAYNWQNECNGDCTQ